MKAAATGLSIIGQWVKKPQFWIVVFIITFALYFYLKGKAAGARKAKNKIKEDLKVDVDSSLLTDEQGEVWSPETITDRLHKDIYSGWLTPRDVDAYKVLLAMSDERIKAVHNYWMVNYFDEDNETLKAAISKENDVIADWSSVKKAVLAKLDNLGLQ